MEQLRATDQAVEPVPKLFVRDLEDGTTVDSVFLVRQRTRRTTKRGKPYLTLELGDVTGVLEAKVWEEADEVVDEAEPGTCVRVFGPYEVHPQYGASLSVRRIRRALEGEYDPVDLLDGPSAPVEQLEGDLRELVATVQDPSLRALLDRFFGEGSPNWERWREAPAAKYYHQAYRHGLLEHCLSVAKGVSTLSSTFPGIDRDVAVTGALLHDIGKVEAYAFTGDAIDLTDAGRLQGEIPLGYYTVRREIEELPGFPPETAQALLHIILAHHGQLEHGSPVLPATREATLVHMVDNLGGRLGSFDRIEKELAQGERWSRFDRALSGSAYFRPPAAQRDAA